MTGDMGLRAAQFLTAMQAALDWLGMKAQYMAEITIVEFHKWLICVLSMPTFVTNGGNGNMSPGYLMMVLGGPYLA
jgi:hypothetical protein